MNTEKLRNNYTPVDVAQLKATYALPSYITEQLDLKRVSPNEWAGACPNCGGRDRFHVNARFWFCRSCAPIDDKRTPHDSIGYIMWRHNVGFLAACELMGAQTPPPPAKIIPAPAKIAPAELNQIAARAHALLLGSHEPAAAYLAGRGIGRDAVLAFRLGARWRGTRFGWAVTMPYYDDAGSCVAIRERLLVPAGSQKIISAAGSQFGGNLFGLQAWFGRSWLIICEGEINAISIHMATGGAVDAVSVGSESVPVATLERIKRLAASAGRVAVWADKGRVAEQLGGALPGALMFKSPLGQDANDLLKTGQLGALLERVGIT